MSELTPQAERIMAELRVALGVRLAGLTDVAIGDLAQQLSVAAGQERACKLTTTRHGTICGGCGTRVPGRTHHECSPVLLERCPSPGPLGDAA